VLLTTLTTVLGLAPLLYEGSTDAQFLKPTVITLVYGLGFGMVIVLLVVPAILAMQQDFAKQITRASPGVAGLGRRKGPAVPLIALAVRSLRSFRRDTRRADRHGGHAWTAGSHRRWGPVRRDGRVHRGFGGLCVAAWIGSLFVGLRRNPA
jgi:hypothetical protein